MKNISKILCVVLFSVITSTACGMEENNSKQFTNGLHVTAVGKSTFDLERAQKLLTGKVDTLCVNYVQFEVIRQVIQCHWSSLENEKNEIFDLDEQLDFVQRYPRNMGSVIKAWLNGLISEYSSISDLIGEDEIVKRTRVLYSDENGNAKIMFFVQRPPTIPEDEYNKVIVDARREAYQAVPLFASLERLLDEREKHVKSVCVHLSDEIYNYAKNKKIEQDPLSFVGECASWTCPISRVCFPEVRGGFNEMVLQEIQKKPHIFVSFACRNLQSTMMLLEALRRQKKLPKKVLLIDFVYKKMLNSMGIHEGAKTTQQLQFNKGSLDRAPSYAITPLEDSFDIVHADGALRQCVQWYNNDGIQFFVYPSAQVYIKDCKRNGVCKADVLIGSDYYEEEEEHKDFQQLKKHCLTNDGVAAELVKPEAPEGEVGPIKFHLATQGGKKSVTHLFGRKEDNEKYPGA